MLLGERPSCPSAGPVGAPDPFHNILPLCVCGSSLELYLPRPACTTLRGPAHSLVTSARPWGHQHGSPPPTVASRPRDAPAMMPHLLRPRDLLASGVALMFLLLCPAPSKAALVGMGGDKKSIYCSRTSLAVSRLPGAMSLFTSSLVLHKHGKKRALALGLGGGGGRGHTPQS